VVFAGHSQYHLHMQKNDQSEYLWLFAEVVAINKRYGLTSYNEVSVLNAVHSAVLENNRLRVLDILLMEDIASQPTLHAILKKLIAKNLLLTKVDSEDGRVKIVLPTKLALKRLKECEALLQKIQKKR